MEKEDGEVMMALEKAEDVWDKGVASMRATRRGAVDEFDPERSQLRVRYQKEPRRRTDRIDKTEADRASAHADYIVDFGICG